MPHQFLEFKVDSYKAVSHSLPARVRYEVFKFIRAPRKSPACGSSAQPKIKS